MGIYKKIFQKITGKEKPSKKRKPMAKTTTPKKRKPIFKKLTPEQKKKALEAFKKGSGAILKYTEGGKKPKVTVKPAPGTPAPARNFWTDTIDMGFIKPTGTQLVVGGTAAAVLGGIAYKSFSKSK